MKLKKKSSLPSSTSTSQSPDSQTTSKIDYTPWGRARFPFMESTTTANQSIVSISSTSKDLELSISEGRERLVKRIRKSIADTEDEMFLIRTQQMMKDIPWVYKELQNELNDDLIKSIDVLHVNDGWWIHTEGDKRVSSVVLKVQLHTLEDL